MHTHWWLGRARLRRRPPHEIWLPLDLADRPGGLSFALYQSLRVALEPGHRVALLQNGEIFEALEHAILGARSSIHLVVYIWRPCAVSDRLVEAILSKARQGVACRIVVDPVGSEDLTGELDFDRSVEGRLREGGCEVSYFRPLAGKFLGRLTGRNHRKILVVDGQVAITGGFGIWKSWEGDGESPEHWRDTHVRVEGPMVRAMQLAFSRDWQEAGGAPLPLEAFPENRPAGPAEAAFVASDGKLGVTDAERLTRILIAGARRRLWIANAYFAPPEEILDLLEQKSRQGVEIRILAAGDIHDVKSILNAQRSTYERLLKAGIRIWEYQPSMMHSKTMLLDDDLALVGSINLDPLSLNKLGEGSLLVHDSGFARELEKGLLRDWAVSREYTLKNGGRNTLRRRFSMWVLRILGKDR